MYRNQVEYELQAFSLWATLHGAKGAAFTVPKDALQTAGGEESPTV